MKRRCGNKNDKSWPNYGGRGISVCERWMTYANFLADMGRRPAGTSLDRIDNNKGYSPDNCRWATVEEQQRNRRNNKLTAEQVREVASRYAAGGVTQTSLAAEYGVSVAVINYVVTGKYWKGIADSVVDKRSTRIGAAKLTGDEVCELRRVYAAGGISLMGVARRYGISKSAAFGIIRGRRWPMLETPKGA